MVVSVSGHLLWWLGMVVSACMQVVTEAVF